MWLPEPQVLTSGELLPGSLRGVGTCCSDLGLDVNLKALFWTTQEAGLPPARHCLLYLSPHTNYLDGPTGAQSSLVLDTPLYSATHSCLIEEPGLW